MVAAQFQQYFPVWFYCVLAHNNNNEKPSAENRNCRPINH